MKNDLTYIIKDRLLRMGFIGHDLKGVTVFEEEDNHVVDLLVEDVIRYFESRM
jgi:hypothetical protein